MKRRNEAPNHIILPKPISFLGWATLLKKNTMPHSNPPSLEVLIREFCSCPLIFYQHSEWDPFSWQRFLSAICLLQLFLWEGPPSAAWQGRELSSQMFSLSPSLSLTLFKVYPLEIFNVQDLFLHGVHTLFYVVWLSFLLTKRHPCALLILAEGEECCLL